MSDAATWQRLLDDDDALKKADPAWLAEQRERWPWFTATPWLQARREVLLQGHSTEATLRQAAAWSGERARLKAWLGGSLRMPLAMVPLELPAAVEPAAAETATDLSDSPVVGEEAPLEAGPAAADTPDREQEPAPSNLPANTAETPADTSDTEQEPVPSDLPATTAETPADTPDTEPEPAPSDLPATTAETESLPEPALMPGISGTVEESQESSKLAETHGTDPKEEPGVQRTPSDTAESAEPFSPVEGERHVFSDWLRRFHAADSTGAESDPVEARPAHIANQPSEHPTAMPAAQQRAQETGADPTTGQTPRFEATEDFQALDGLIARQRRRTAASRARENSSVPHVPAGEEDFPGPLTETWARILADQGKTPEAIAVYEALGLRQPEKSAFFAARIQELKAR